MASRGLWQQANDSKSLWNYTLSPGWTHSDVQVLRKAVIKYGCGNWQKITKHFPNKTCGQLNLQTQRLFGQQSLAEFFRLHIDPKVIKEENDKIEGGLRKNGCIINTGDNMTVEQRKAKREENRAKYELPKNEYQNIDVPIVYDEIICTNLQTKIKKLSKLYRCLYAMEKRYSNLELPQRISEQCSNTKKTTAVPLTAPPTTTDATPSGPTMTATTAKVSKPKKTLKSAKKTNKKRKKMDKNNSDDEYMPNAKRQRTKK